MPEQSFWRTVFTPRWFGLLLLALTLATVMSVMGVWQLQVYQSKTAAATAKRAEGAPVALQSLFSIDEGLPSKAVGRRVTVTGTWGPTADQLFITDRRNGTQDGLWVVTPLMLDGASAEQGAVMVVRGWVSSTSDPAAKAPTGPVSLTGAVAASEAQDASADAASRVLPSLRIPTIVHMVDYRIYDAFVVQTSLDSGTTPQPAPAVVPPPAPPTDHAGLRNVAYAFQWWIFAAFTLWMWTRMVQDARRPHPDDDPDQDPTLDPTPNPPTESTTTAPGSAGPGGAGTGSGEPGSAGAASAEAGNAETASAGARNAETASTGPGSTGTASAGTASTGTASAGTVSTGTASAGSASTGTASTGTASAGTASAGTASAGAGSGGAGSGGTVNRAEESVESSGTVSA